ncbi:hypothetical protein SNEBB_003022 [Seison nebaliae]|nr:hypothetical protein SNEBB_003022 [Seison nebaliae]
MSLKDNDECNKLIPFVNEKLFNGNNQKLQSLPTELIDGNYIERIHLRDNFIEHLPHRLDFPILQFLDLSFNPLVEIPYDFYRYVPSLRELYLESTKLSSWFSIEQIIKISPLRTLSIIDTPINERTTCRNYILYRMPNLSILNGKETTIDDMNEANEKYNLLSIIMNKGKENEMSKKKEPNKLETNRDEIEESQPVLADEIVNNLTCQLNQTCEKQYVLEHDLLQLKINNRFNDFPQETKELDMIISGIDEHRENLFDMPYIGSSYSPYSNDGTGSAVLEIVEKESLEPIFEKNKISQMTDMNKKEPVSLLPIDSGVQSCSYVTATTTGDEYGDISVTDRPIILSLRKNLPPLSPTSLPQPPPHQQLTNISTIINATSELVSSIDDTNAQTTAQFIPNTPSPPIKRCGRSTDTVKRRIRHRSRKQNNSSSPNKYKGGSASKKTVIDTTDDETQWSEIEKVNLHVLRDKKYEEIKGKKQNSDNLLYQEDRLSNEESLRHKINDIVSSILTEEFSKLSIEIDKNQEFFSNLLMQTIGKVNQIEYGKNELHRSTIFNENYTISQERFAELKYELLQTKDLLERERRERIELEEELGQLKQKLSETNEQKQQLEEKSVEKDSKRIIPNNNNEPLDNEYPRSGNWRGKCICTANDSTDKLERSSLMNNSEIVREIISAELSQLLTKRTKTTKVHIETNDVQLQTDKIPTQNVACSINELRSPRKEKNVKDEATQLDNIKETKVRRNLTKQYQELEKKTGRISKNYVKLKEQFSRVQHELERQVNDMKEKEIQLHSQVEMNRTMSKQMNLLKEKVLNIVENKEQFLRKKEKKITKSTNTDVIELSKEPVNCVKRANHQRQQSSRPHESDGSLYSFDYNSEVDHSAQDDKPHHKTTTYVEAKHRIIPSRSSLMLPHILVDWDMRTCSRSPMSKVAFHSTLDSLSSSSKNYYKGNSNQNVNCPINQWKEPKQLQSTTNTTLRNNQFRLLNWHNKRLSCA